jgi:predicted ribonuclease toxin of YeeF-YezG toxin-antitoxin module
MSLADDEEIYELQAQILKLKEHLKTKTCEKIYWSMIGAASQKATPIQYLKEAIFELKVELPEFFSEEKENV